ncbi:MAG: UbiA family prenyltransferase [Planctomycetales bacterium]|nr:UbiA family prenyltransferase [Planctomycetales bacterium]
MLAGAAAAALLNAASNALNAVADRRADAANKPDRPLVSGALGPGQAGGLAAIAGAAGLALASAATPPGGPPGFVLCALAAGLATAAYSCRPLRLKRWAWRAGASIALARGLLLLVAGWATVGSVVRTAVPWALGGVFFLFLVGAAATKDFSDVEGDRAEGVRTWPVTLGAERASRRVAPFLVWPWMLFAAAAWLPGLPGSPALWVGGSASLVLHGAFWARALVRDPAARAGENHPSWRGMYALMVHGQAVVAAASIA